MNKKTQNKLIEISRGLIEHPNSSFKHFSFILKKNKIVSIGWNDKRRTHPVAKRFCHRFSSVHSELAAIGKFPYRPNMLSEHRIANVRLNRQGKVMCSHPCKSCEKMLRYFGFQEMWYSTYWEFADASHERFVCLN